MMERVSTIADIRRYVRQWRRDGMRIGFVPTMGNLHDGHLRLVEQAAGRAQRVVVSIFVNPMQFDAADDFACYPRTLVEDMEKLEAVKADLVFTPDEATIYPHGAQDNAFVDVPHLSAVLEGAHRPGHFRGVATVVSKLFNIVQPDVAVFGEKDYQQLLLIRRLAQELDFPIEIEAVPTVRDADGLALSSRNRRLDPEQRACASALPATLSRIVERIDAGEVEYARLEQQGVDALREAGLEPEYVAVRDANNLGPPQSGAALVVLGAARVGAVRLIDVWRAGE